MTGILTREWNWDPDSQEERQGQMKSETAVVRLQVECQGRLATTGNEGEAEGLPWSLQRAGLCRYPALDVQSLGR